MRLRILMNLFVFIIFVSPIFANLNSSYLKNLINYKRRGNAAIDTINFCFCNEAKHGIVFVGNSENFNIDLLMNYGPVINFNDKALTNKLNKKYKLNVFIVTTEPDFKNNIQQLKKSPWWNHEGFFIILENSLTNSTRCKYARKILQRAWKMDILRTIFICTGGENDYVNFYTFNPFTNRAPSYWKISNYDKKKTTEDDDKWTLYRRQYNPKLLNCISLDYDKTRHLDGYKGIKAGFNGNYANDEHKLIIEYLYKRLNVKLSYLKMNDDLNMIDGIANSSIGNLLVNGSIDISIQLAGLVYMKDIVASNIIFSNKLTFLSQDRGKKTMFKQIYELFGWRLLLIMLFFSATTVLAFKICMKMDVDLAILEIIRMWGNASFLKQPIDSPSRIYLFGILLLALILCTVFQGKILGFQLNPNSEKNIDSMNDLIVKFKNYKIYGPNWVLQFLDEKLNKQTIEVQNFESCIEHVLNDSSSVCAHRMPFLKNISLHYQQLYLAKNPFIEMYAVMVMRKNWPLTKRVNEILNKYFEYDLKKFKLLHFNKMQNNITSDKPRPLKRQHINFALKFLAAGLTTGFIIFIIELFWHKKTRSIILQLSIITFYSKYEKKIKNLN